MIQRTELDAAGEAAFQQNLIALVPPMRAFARALTGDAASADDLAQEALVKAWSHRTAFQLGTNMKAWTFMIVRNHFYSEKRRSWRGVQLDPEVAEKTLLANDDASAVLELEDLRQALNHLPAAQREAIILVGAGGLSYEEAAEVCGCAVGTVKSRVSRGRDTLQALLSDGDFDRTRAPASEATSTLLDEVQSLRLRSGRPDR